MKVTISTIPHKSQRYDTCGDWQTGPKLNEFWITVSKMSDWRYEFLVGIHEAIEAALCIHAGVTDEDVTVFDEAFEKRRPEGNADEPGDDPAAPYRRQHLIASGIERLLAAELGVNWKAYDDEVEAQ